MASSSEDEAATLTAAGEHSVNCVVTQGWSRRQRPSSIVEDCTFVARRSTAALRIQVLGGWKGESLKPASWALGECS